MRPLIVFSSLLLAVAIVLVLCALFGVGTANQYDPGTPRWTTLDVAALFFAASALSFAVTSLTIVRLPVGTRIIIALALLGVAGYSGFVGYFMAFFVG